MAEVKQEKTSKKLERDEKGRLLPGQESLNPNGRPEGSISLTAMIKKKLELLSPDGKRQAIEMLADNIIQDALDSSDNMRKLIWNYLDGLPKFSGDFTSGGEPLGVIFLPRRKQDNDKQLETLKQAGDSPNKE